MAEKDKEETGSTRRRSARRENKENYVDSPLNYENTGFILPSPDPSSHHLLDKHSPRRRSSLLHGMDFEAEEARRQAQGQAEYARALDAQVRLFIQRILQYLCGQACLVGMIFKDIHRSPIDAM